jgi:hypothetical protein
MVLGQRFSLYTVNNELKHELEDFWGKHATGFNHLLPVHTKSLLMQEIGTTLSTLSH